jgi:hypothetical protein
LLDSFSFSFADHEHQAVDPAQFSLITVKDLSMVAAEEDRDCKSCSVESDCEQAASSRTGIGVRRVNIRRGTWRRL